LVLPLLSQTKGNISICVRDSADKALSDVGVLFFQSDSLVAGIVTGKGGCFSLGLDTGNYAVHITHLGYEEYDENIHLTATSVRLPAIILKEAAVELDAVTVSNRTFSAESNRSLFRIPANVKSSSTDIYRILATVPALIINPVEQTATIAGSDNSIIMVNNIRRDKNYLLTLNPKNIDRVEITRNPGSRYQNVDGIINIVTKVPETGQSFNLSGRLEPTLEQGFSSAYYQLVTKKISASLFAMHFFFDDANEEESIIRDVSVGDDVIHTERKTNADLSLFIYTSVGANIDYTISPKTFMSFGLDYTSYSSEHEIPYKGMFSGNSREYEFDAYNETESEFNEYKLNLYYQTDFTKTSSMSIDARYNLTSIGTSSLYNESNNSGHFYKNNRIDNTDNNILEAQINFRQQLSKVRLEEGYRAYSDNNIINNETNGVFNRTDHNEWRHYLYTNLLGDIREKFVYQAGIGFDMSRVTLNKVLSTHNEFTPNVVLRYIMKEGQNISFNYSLTRKSPPSSALNPIPSYVDSSRIITGNPDLKPYYLNVLGLNYELRKNKIYIQPSLRYNLASNYITNRENSDEHGVYHITYVNASRYSSATVALNASYDIFNWWNVTMYGSMRYNMYEDDNLPELNKNYWTPYMNLQSSVNYKKLAVSLYYPFIFRLTTLRGYSTGVEDSSITASYRLNNSWTVTGMIRQLSPKSYKSETFGDGFSEIYYTKQTDRYFRFVIGVVYRFQKGEQQNARQKNVKSYNDGAAVGAQSY
jgi:hypothetical protein